MYSHRDTKTRRRRIRKRFPDSVALWLCVRTDGGRCTAGPVMRGKTKPNLGEMGKPGDCGLLIADCRFEGYRGPVAGGPSCKTKPIWWTGSREQAASIRGRGPTDTLGKTKPIWGDLPGAAVRLSAVMERSYERRCRGQQYERTKPILASPLRIDDCRLRRGGRVLPSYLLTFLPSLLAFGSRGGEQVRG
jgi:hypothetical protein